jgi:ABC-type transporter Mla subunit MlaD
MSEVQPRRWFDPSGALGWLPLVGGVLLGGWFLVVAWNQQAWLQSSFTVRFRTADASGLWPGVHVTLAGYRVGRVERVKLEGDGQVGVELRIAETYRRLIGPRTSAWSYQEGLIGPSQVGLSADVTPAGTTPPTGDRRVAFKQGADVAQLLKDLGETRVKLNRTLESTASLAGQQLPVAIAGFKRTMKKVKQLGERVEKEATLTGSATRQTLAVYARTGEHLGEASQQVSKTGEESLRVLRVTEPALLETLKEVRTLTRRTNQLLDALGVSPAREP